MSAVRCALVTGGTRGIGRAVVERLARDGFRVVFSGRTPESVASARDAMLAEGLDVHGTPADVRELASIVGLVSFALERAEESGIHVLVNNAGRPGGGITAEISDALWNDVIETNLNALFRVTREVLRRGKMVERGWGRIINIASTGGKQGVALGAPYTASKHGVVGFSKALGLELAKTGVTVNAVCPGFVETDMAREVRNGYSSHWQCDEQETKRRIEQRIPTGHYVMPTEVAELVAFLASPSQQSITAQALNVCGGLGSY